MLERSGEKGTSKIRAKVIADTTQLHGEVKANVETGVEVFTDADRGFDADLERLWVDHAVEYVQGLVHTNGVENFWSLIDRMFHGTYTYMEPYHLQKYINEQLFRFSSRKDNDSGRFK